MNRFQDVSFGSVNEFLGYLPPEELVIVEYLRDLVVECVPDVREKLAYNVPFYYRFSRICFIWPGSVPWGRTPKTGVEFGFCFGHLLSDPGYMNRGSRKEVTVRTFHSLREINVRTLRSLLMEAVVIDEELHRIKKGR